MAHLSTIPPPGLAINPSYIAQTQGTLHLHRSSALSDWYVRLDNGAPLLTITREARSLFHRKTIIDASGRQLGQIKRVRHHSPATYYFETVEDGLRVWELVCETRVFKGTRYTFSFANVVDGKRVELVFEHKSTERTGKVKYGGVDVAFVEREKRGNEWRIVVAQGMDMSAVVGLIVAVDDRVKTAAAAGAAASAGGA